MTLVSKAISAKRVRFTRDADITTIAEQTATASYVDLTGSKVDAANASSLAYTVKNTHATLTTKYKVMGAINDVDAEYVEVQAEATVAANGGTGSYSTTNPTFRFYKIKIIDGSGHGKLEGACIIKD